jgi:WD40 repeat protein
MLVLQGARKEVAVLQFSPDGRTLAAPCSGGVQLWSDLPRGASTPTVLPSPSLQLVRFTPDGRKVLLDGMFARTFLHDLQTGKAVKVAPQLLGGGPGCDLTPDGNFIVGCRLQAELIPPDRLFCVPVEAPETLLWTVASPRWFYSRPVFLADGERFVVLEAQPTSLGQPVVYYVTRDRRMGEVVAQVAAEKDSFHNLVRSADGRLIAGRRMAWIAIWTAGDLGASPTRVRNDSHKDFTGLAFHPSGRYLAATSNDATVKLYDTTTWKVAQAFNWDIGRLRSVAFSPDGMLAAAGGARGKIVVWDVDL